jgi:RNA polymerase sigma factor (sigma-70 family)
MTRRSSGAVLRQIHTLFTAGSSHGLSDRQLLDRFVAHRDAVAELAFATLVERHGAMVLGVCRRILADSHEAEDAFQATFLVLVRQAGSIRADGSLGRWLYGVATRVATPARANARRRQARERSGPYSVDVRSRETSTDTTGLADVQMIVAEELDRLPARFKAPIVLCDLEGRSNEEAAHFLGCPVGTVKSRLSRARTRLRRGLIRRGLAPPDLSNIVPLFPTAVPRRLAEATNRAAQVWNLGRLSTAQIISASVSGLTEGVLWTMFLTKLKFAAAALLLIATGSAILVNQATAQKPAAHAGAVGKTDPPAAGAAPVPDDAVDLEMLERAWVDALNRRDAAVIGRIMADDFAGIDSAGSTFTRESYLLDVRNGAFPAETVEQDEVKIRLFDDSAVVTGRIKLKNGPRWSGLTNVYVKRQDRWRCVASQASWIGAAMTIQPSRWTKEQEETHLTNEQQLRRQLMGLKEKLAIAEMRNAHPRENSKKDQADIPSNQLDGARSPNAAAPDTGQPASAARESNVPLLHQVLPEVFSAQPPEHVIRIRPRFESLVERVYVRPGQTVKKGDALVDVSGVDLAAAKNDYLAKEVQSKNDQKILALRRKLYADKAISEQLWTDTQNDEAKSKLTFEVARDKLKMLGLDDEAIGRVGKEDGGQKARMTLRSPADATVSKVDVELGNLYDTKSVLLYLHATSPGQSTQP